MKKRTKRSTLGAEMVAGLSAFCDAIEAKEPIAKRYTVRTLTLDLDPTPYAAADVRNIRALLNASQALLAKFLGVSVNAVRSWEQGTRRVPKIACRFMDEIKANPKVWKQRVKRSTSSHRETVES